MGNLTELDVENKEKNYIIRQLVRAATKDEMTSNRLVVKCSVDFIRCNFFSGIS